MESFADNTPVVVILGPTASGKSAIAIDMALRFNGEIVCADSRTLYKGMNIGTAKPPRQDRKIVPHHLLDIRPPSNPISVMEFKHRAIKVIRDIGARGKVAFLVGGSGLYIDAVLYDFSFRGAPDRAKRQELGSKNVVELQSFLQSEGIELPENAYNPRHLIRRLETKGEDPKRAPLRPNTLILGLEIDAETLKRNIHQRIDHMFDQGLEKEVMKLVAKYDWYCSALQTIGYQEFQPYFESLCTREDVQKAIEQHTIKYAKRQKTWFKRNKDIIWIYKAEQSVDLITSLLNK